MIKIPKNIPPAFSSHKVTIKSIKKWNGSTYIWKPPCNAINYLHHQEVAITIIKQRESSIKILIECADIIYKHIKLDFVCSMGDNFIWSD